MSENALIERADLKFSDISGQNGQQFSLQLHLKTTRGGVNVTFNPLRLPQLLKQLGLERFNKLEGTYIQITDTKAGAEVKGIKSILATDKEEWFKTENGIYFGSNFVDMWERELERVKNIEKVYEVWYDYFDGTQANLNGYEEKMETYLFKEKAEKRVAELNNEIEHENPYFLKEVELND